VPLERLPKSKPQTRTAVPHADRRLPYPPLEEWRKWAEKLDMGANVSIFMRQRFNQAAIFANL